MLCMFLPGTQESRESGSRLCQASCTAVSRYLTVCCSRVHGSNGRSKGVGQPTDRSLLSPSFRTSSRWNFFSCSRKCAYHQGSVFKDLLLSDKALRWVCLQLSACFLVRAISTSGRRNRHSILLLSCESEMRCWRTLPGVCILLFQSWKSCF